MSAPRRKATPFAGPEVSLVTTKRQLTKLMKSYAADPLSTGYPQWSDLEAAYGVTWTLDIEGLDVYVVGLNIERLEDAAAIVTTMVHEAVHVKQGWMESMGETSPSSEFEAYTVERIVASLMDQYKPKAAA